MAKPWRRERFARQLGIPITGVLVAALLSGCLGWYPQFSTNDSSSLNGISCPSSSECFAVGASTSGAALVEQTTDAGGHWVSDTTGVSGPALNSISCADLENCVAVATSGATLVTTDGGATWDPSTTGPSTNIFPTSVSCPDAEHCWAVGNGGLIVTTNGGVTWTPLTWEPPPPRGDWPGSVLGSFLSAVTCTTTSDCLAVGQVAYQEDPPPETTLPSFTDSLGVLVTTSDGGETWQSQLVSSFTEFPISPNSYTDVAAISCPTPEDCVAVGGGASYQFVTADSGMTWTVSQLAQNQPVDDAGIACSDPLHCIAVGGAIGSKYQTPVMATSDGGTTWSNQATNPSGAILTGVTCVTSSSCWAVGSTPSGMVILHTLNGGQAAPMVSGISPNQGTSNGGTEVTITGGGFQFGAPSVQFGSSPATAVTVLSGSVISATAPPSASSVPDAGSTVDVTVTNPLGESPLNTNDQFTYVSASSDGSAEQSALPMGNLLLYWLRLTGEITLTGQ